MLNAYPLNASPLNDLLSVGGGGVAAIVQRGSFAWSLQVLIAGVDVSSVLTGAVSISRSEDGDAVARFSVYLGAGPIDVLSYTGATLTIDFVVRGDPDVVSRRFTGYLVQPSFDVYTRVLECEATTRLADSVERLELEAIDLLVGGYWSADVFEEVAGRSRWEYAQERISTQPASLNVDRYGLPRVTSWDPPAVFKFGAGTTVYESLDVALAALGDTPNVYELELDYRFSRYRQRDQAYVWLHPGTDGNQGLLGFEAWRADSTELPDIAMITDAVESAGWWISNPGWYRLFGDLPDLDQPWYNDNIDLLLGASFTASVRWSQRAVEQYRLRLEVSASVAAVGEVIERDRVVLDTETDVDRLWDESTGATDAEPIDDPVDALPRRDQERLDAAVRCALGVGRTRLLAGHRGNSASWQVPLAHALGVDFGQRLLLDDAGAHCAGTVVELAEEIDVATGSALLTVTVGVSRAAAGAVADPLDVPEAPEFEDAEPDTINPVLPTQLGLRAESPLYDEDLAGFAGSYSIGNGDPDLRYPRRFMIITPEIPDQWRDEVQAEQPVTYRVAPPVDLLEL